MMNIWDSLDEVELGDVKTEDFVGPATIRMSTGRSVNINLENWTRLAGATDYNYGETDPQIYSTLEVLGRSGVTKFLVFGKRKACSNDGWFESYAGLLITDEADLPAAMRQVMGDLGVDDAELLRKWVQDLPAVDLD